MAQRVSYFHKGDNARTLIVGAAKIVAAKGFTKTEGLEKTLEWLRKKNIVLTPDGKNRIRDVTAEDLLKRLYTYRNSKTYTERESVPTFDMALPGQSVQHSEDTSAMLAEFEKEIASAS